MLATRFRTLRNEGNLNNEIGLPLTLMRLGPEHEAAVLEMGMYVGGEIADLARMAQPRIGVITAVQPVHLARIGSLEAIEAAKGELLEALPPDGRRDPQRRRPDRPPDGHIARRRAASPTASRPTPTSARTPSRSAGLDGMRFILRAQGARRPVEHPDARPAVGPQRAGRGRGRPGRRPVARRDRDRPRGRLVGAPPGPARPARRGHPRRRHVQRLAAVGRRGARPAGRPARPAGGGARRDARARRGAATRAIAPSARRPHGRSTGSSWSVPAQRASPRAPRRPGWTRPGSSGPRRRGRPRGDPAAAP